MCVCVLVKYVISFVFKNFNNKNFCLSNYRWSKQLKERSITKIKRTECRFEIKKKVYFKDVNVSL